MYYEPPARKSKGRPKILEDPSSPLALVHYYRRYDPDMHLRHCLGTEELAEYAMKDF